MTPDDPGFRALALCDRAYAFLQLSNRGPVAEEALLAHVYGGAPPAGLHARLAKPLLGDPRLVRRPDGHWTIAGDQAGSRATDVRELAFTALALVASGPNPERGRIVQVAALHAHIGSIVERFSSIVNPGTRVPRYVADRIGLAPEMLENLPPFTTVLDDLVRFLDARPIVAQDARLTWAFVEAEARRAGQVLAERLLIDANELATHLLELPGKPTLALVAARLGIGTLRVTRPDEEARVLSLVMPRLLALAVEQSPQGAAAILEAGAAAGRAPLRTEETLRALADVPGIYVMRDLNEQPVYVGKARRLRSRVAAYVHRPLGATRRLEGLVGAVHSVDSTECATDLEALILESREIRRLSPRFNTARQQNAPRLWIRRPPAPEPRPGKRQLAPARLELSQGPAQTSVAGEFVGPFRNEGLAAHARLLARRVFALDTLRRDDRDEYVARLSLAWRFLKGETDTAVAYARRGPTGLVRQVLDLDWHAALLPADPRVARYAILRPALTGIEGFLVDRCILRGWVPPRTDADFGELAMELLGQSAARTQPEDVDVVLRWLGALRAPTCLVLLPEDPLAAADAIDGAASGLGDALAQASLSQLENAG